MKDAFGTPLKAGDLVVIAERGGTSFLCKGKVQETGHGKVKINIGVQDTDRFRTTLKFPTQIAKLEVINAT